ncbi:MAG: GlxA family transcriptional regulator [Alphaproteobacteria bacterium]|nr:GlxA family transcriptional regulator [Alphaproteobacteria bacterium]
MPEPEHYHFLLVPDYTHLAFSCAIEPLRLANLLSGQNLYRWSLMSENGQDQICSTGTTILVDQGFDRLEPGDQLIVVAGANVPRHTTPALVDYVRRQSRHGVRLGAVCSASYVLAKTGLLDGKSCAIHWAYHDILSEEFPAIRLRRSVYVSDEPIVSASGGPAAADLMLHMISEAHGHDLASQIADQMVYNAVRSGVSEQRLSFSARFGMRNHKIVRAFRIMESHVEDRVKTTEIASELGITVRQLQRLFNRFVGKSPARVYSEIRLDKARNLLLQTDMSVTEVSVACGFGSTSNFSKSYREYFGHSPNSEGIQQQIGWSN